MANILILGANGLIGAELQKQLSKNNKVFCFSRSGLSGSDCFVGDFFETESFVNLLHSYKIEVVVHLISDSLPATPFSHNVQPIYKSTYRLLLDCMACHVKKLIYVSSGGCVYGESPNYIPFREDSPLRPICYYGLQKMLIENLLLGASRDKDIEVRIARPSNVYGRNSSCCGRTKTYGLIPFVVNKFLANENITLFGNAVRDYIHVSDLAKGLERLIMYNGAERVFNFGTGIPTKSLDVLRMVSQSFDFESVIKYSIENIREFDVNYNVLDCSRAKVELNWEYETGLLDGIKDFL